jgi:hypothetical protein
LGIEQPRTTGAAMSMFNLAEQLNGSFEELMLEIRAMRRELEGIRKELEAQADRPPATKPATKVARGAAARPPHVRTRKRVA